MYEYNYSTSYDPEVMDAMGPVFAVMGIVYLIIAVFFIIVMWKLFTKMNEPGWKAIIPFYNLYIWYQKIFGNGLYMLFIFVVCIPFVGGLLLLLLNVIGAIRMAKSFGRGSGTIVGLVLAAPIFYAILAFGSAEYNELPAWDPKDPFK